MQEEAFSKDDNAQAQKTESGSHFTNQAAVATYAQNPPRVVPGFADMQRMAMLLLAERAPADARVLVLGAGGGLELSVFAQANPRWQFDGVDPSAEMLDLARATLGPLAERVQLHQGYIDAAPEETYDGAACLLTLHFVSREERLRTLIEIRRRLKPGAPFVVAHLSFPQNEPDRARWLSRYASFAASSGIAPAAAQQAGAAIRARLPLLSPEEDETLLQDAGFSGVTLFYMGFCFRGWVAYN